MDLPPFRTDITRRVLHSHGPISIESFAVNVIVLLHCKLSLTHSPPVQCQNATLVFAERAQFRLGIASKVGLNLTLELAQLRQHRLCGKIRHAVMACHAYA